ncbi:MAG: hypothetical protein RLN89_02520 [Parvibaculum sp.]
MIHSRPFTCLLIVSLLGGLLTACASAEDRAREQALHDRTDHQHCLDLGFEPNTEAYGNCRLKLKEIRASEKQPENNTRFGVGVGIGIGL